MEEEFNKDYKSKQSIWSDRLKDIDKKWGNPFTGYGISINEFAKVNGGNPVSLKLDPNYINIVTEEIRLDIIFWYNAIWVKQL